jgi:hypothetical protein
VDGKGRREGEKRWASVGEEEVARGREAPHRLRELRECG